MKKFFMGLLVGILITIPVTIMAANSDTITAKLKHDLKIKLNDQELQLETTPINYDGWTYLPLRETASIAGMEVGWDSDTETVLLSSELEETEPIVEEPQIIEEGDNVETEEEVIENVTEEVTYSRDYVEKKIRDLNVDIRVISHSIKIQPEETDEDLEFIQQRKDMLSEKEAELAEWEAMLTEVDNQ